MKITFESPWEDINLINPYISIADPDYEIKAQIHPDEIVIPMKEIRIEYSYPLNKPLIFFFESDNEIGFSRSELAQKICQKYQQIYEIWGYVIGDLMLHTVTQVEGNLFKLSVDL
jgi:hypothetical protein